MDPFNTIALGIFMFTGALLYSSVGHGGASAYLALMGLWGVEIADMKSIALVLNIFVAAIALVHFLKVGHFSQKLFWPLVVTSVPMAFLGGMMKVDAKLSKVIIAVALLIAALRLIIPAKNNEQTDRPVFLIALFIMGGIIGWISGMVGIGGGIFLTPILIFMKYTSIKSASGVSAAFILVNSSAGFAGLLANGVSLPSMTWMLLPFVVFGGWIGARWGRGIANTHTTRRLLAAVLFVAVVKFTII